MHPARFCLRKNFDQRLQRRRMGMPNGDGFSLILRAAERQLELLAHRGYFGDVVKERNIPETGTYTEALRSVIGNGRCGGAAVHVKEIPLLKNGHKLFHERGVGGGLRAL